jgi:hypothetical protein
VVRVGCTWRGRSGVEIALVAVYNNSRHSCKVTFIRFVIRVFPNDCILRFNNSHCASGVIGYFIPQEIKYEQIGIHLSMV